MPDENPNEPDWSYQEREAVYVLTDPTRYPPIWALADMALEFNTHDPAAIVAPLIRAGLIRRTSEDLLFATPAAFKWVEMVGHVS